MGLINGTTRRFLAFGLGTLMLLGAGLTGCRGQRDSWEGTRERIEAKLAEAKAHLAAQRYTDAKLAFEAVFDITTNNDEARFGMVLSELLQFASIVRVVSSLTGGNTAAADENTFLHNLIDDLLTDLRSRFERMAFQLALLKGNPAFRFVLSEPTPVYLTNSETPDFDLQGEWDRGDVFLVDAAVQAVLGVLNAVQALDLRADYLGIYNRFVELDLNLSLDTSSVESTLASIERELPKVQNLLAYILNANPNFLGLDPGTGADQLAEAGLRFANAIDDIRKGLFFNSYDINLDADQSDDVVGFEGSTPIDPTVDPCAVRDSGDEAAIAAATYTFKIRLGAKADGPGWTKDEATLEASPVSACFMAKLAYGLMPEDDPRLSDPSAAIPEQLRISLADDVVPLVVSMLANTSFGGLINENTLISFIGDAVELDPGAPFYAGKGVRDYLPAWDTPALQPDADARLLWLELECVYDAANDAVVKDRATRYPQLVTLSAEQPYRLVDRLYCRDDVANDVLLRTCDADGGEQGLYCDVYHFPGYNPAAVTPEVQGVLGSLSGLTNDFGIGQRSPDGIDSVFPYVAFQDPTFGGLLYLDVYSFATDALDTVPDELLAIDSSSGFEPATLDALNAYLALLGTKLGGILDLVSSL